jgi:hypothetical protein
VDALLFLDIRAVAVSLHRRCRAHFMYRAATFNLNHTFPDAAPADLARHGGDCAICRDALMAGKLLPCGHVFHMSCLRAWLQQSGSDNFTCPNCRLPLFLADGKRGPDLGAAEGAPEAQQPHLLARLLHATLTSAGGGNSPSHHHHYHHHHHQHGGYGQGYTGAEDASSAPGDSSEEWEEQEEEDLDASDLTSSQQSEEEEEEEEERGVPQQRQQIVQAHHHHSSCPDAAAPPAQPEAAPPLQGPAAAAGQQQQPASSGQGAQPGRWRSTSDVTGSRLAAAASRSCSLEPSSFTGGALPHALGSLSQKVRQAISGAAAGAGAAAAGAGGEVGDEADSGAGPGGPGASASELTRRAGARRRQGPLGGRGGQEAEAAVGEAAAGGSRGGLRRCSARALSSPPSGAPTRKGA